MVDAMIKNGCLVAAPTGDLAQVDGADALFQRSVIARTVPKGSFIYNRELGAGEYPENEEKLSLVLREATAFDENAAVSVTRIGENSVTAVVTINGESRETEVRQFGSI